MPQHMIRHVLQSSCLNVTVGGKPSVKLQTHGWNESAGGRGIPRISPIFFFFSSFFLTLFLWSALSTSPTKKRDDCCVLGVCVCLRSVATLRDTPTLVLPSGDNCVRGWKGGGGGGEEEEEGRGRENLSRLDLAGGSFPSLCNNPPCPSTRARGAPARGSCLAFGGISQLHRSRTLCHTETLQNNGNPSR